MSSLEQMREQCDECTAELEIGQIGKCNDCQPSLPPDPEGMNEQRAEWAAQSLRAMKHETRCETDEMLRDLLANLMHWCDRNGQDFDAALDFARTNYDAETAA